MVTGARLQRLGSRLLAAVALLMLAGCGLADAPVLDPDGPITSIELELLLTTFSIMMIVVVPVWVLAFWFARRYRASHPAPDYHPEWTGSAPVEAVVWLVPAAIIVTLGIFVWVFTHKLDPYRDLRAYGEIDPTGATIEVQAIAQDWKWLFLYPDLGIATVNELAFPAGAPLRLSMTSDTVMNAFYIPALGSQIYAMAGMETQLNLMAWEPGRFVGRNAQFSGSGFPEQYFSAFAMTDEDFAAWVDKVKASGKVLDQAAYEALRQPTVGHDVTYYRSYEAGIYDGVIASYMGPMSHDMQSVEE